MLLGDSIHNFCDGIIIAAAFLTDVRLGWVTSLAIVAHEIPQEVGDYIVLLNAGLSRGKALLYNALSGLSAVVGGVVGLVSSLGVTVLSPAVWEAVLKYPAGSAPFQYASPAIFSMTAAFLTIFLVSKFDRSAQAQLERALYPAQKVRSETGLGASSAAAH